MKTYNLRPDAAAYTALIDACAKTGDVAAADDVISSMRRARVDRTAPVYTGLMQAHVSQYIYIYIYIYTYTCKYIYIYIYV